MKYCGYNKCFSSAVFKVDEMLMFMLCTLVHNKGRICEGLKTHAELGLVVKGKGDLHKDESRADGCDQGGQLRGISIILILE